MRLLAHNIWQCNRPGCGGFPLIIELASQEELDRRQAQRKQFAKEGDIELNALLSATEVVTRDLHPLMVRSMLTKVDWEALVVTAGGLGLSLPPSYSEADLEDEQFLRAVHHALFEFQVLEGTLHCPLCQASFVIEKGIPDFVTDEVA